MIDNYHLPKDTGSSDVQIFNNPATVTNTQWQTYRKPRGKTMLSVLCIGGGGGGGGGFTRASGNGGGGGSGACSGVTRVVIPFYFLPDTLYVQVGAGGGGVGSGGGTSGSGVNSFVSVAPDSTATNILAVANTNLPGGGGTGTGAAVGGAGTVPTVALIAGMPLAGLGYYQMIVGIVGLAGGAVAGANGAATAIPTTSCVTMPGSSGAGTSAADFIGGAFTAIASSYISEQRPATPASGTTGAGSGGPVLWKPFFSFGGGGGSSSNLAAGAAGGNGGYGSSGGGGGSGTTGGRGGDGGSGIVIMTAW